MLNPADVLEIVIRPALARTGLASPAAEALLLGTALAESALSALRQSGGGPAIGLFQMEPATHDDIHDNYLAHRPALRNRVTALAAATPDLVAQLGSNLAYAGAMCRVHYLRVPAPLPRAADAAGMAAYWKNHYNTPLGHGTADRFEALYRKHVRPRYADGDA